ncbi:MAG: ATP cone domain-containing protein [Gemmataceae bacterium]
MERAAAAGPVWVHKRDGRLVPFEADEISRDLFAASERLGQPNAFLARELTDGIVYFLTTELSDTIPTTAQVRDIAAKVVRELGYPALAAAFTEHLAPSRSVAAGAPHLEPSPSAVSSLHACLASGAAPWNLAWQLAGEVYRRFSLQEVFSRDIAAAHHDGLLTLGNLDTPAELAAGTVRLGGERTEALLPALAAARRLFGACLALDGLEYDLIEHDHPQALAWNWLSQLPTLLSSLSLRLIINLNCATPPAWAEERTTGPLFAGQRRLPEQERLADIQATLLEQFLSFNSRDEDGGAWRWRVDWHLGERDFTAAGAGRLFHLLRRALEGAPLAFVFDRPRRPVSLAEGMDRRYPAVLMTVGLHLPRLIEQIGPPAEPGRYLDKLGSLARLALSAATQKREFLRRMSTARPGLTSGFLLDRARVLVAPVGLAATVRQLLGQGWTEADSALELARQIARRLHDTLRQDGRARLLETALDAVAGFHLGDMTEQSLDPRAVAGLTAWEPRATPRQQLQAASAVQAVADPGSAALLDNAQHPLSVEDALALTRWAWQHTDIGRLHFARRSTGGHQLTAPW